MDSTTTVIAIKIGLAASIFTFFEYFGIPREPFTLLGVLMIIDMLTGVAKQYSISPTGITSHKWWIGLMKKIFTLIGICAIAICIKAMGFSGGGFVALTLSAFIASETYSIIQNWYIMRTGKFLPEFDATGMVIKAIATFLRNRIELETANIEKQGQSIKE